MPRRDKPDPLGEKIGKRIRELRKEAGLTLEKLAYESDIGSKGYLSDIERGYAIPSLHKLQQIADHLDVMLFDLLVFPDDGIREELTNQLRSATKSHLRRLNKASID